MSTYYKSIRYINGKSRWVVEDEDGNINKNPTKEQLKIAILEDRDHYIKNRHKGIRCCKCSKDLSIGKDHGCAYYDEKENWDGKSYVCNGCYVEYTHNDVIKSMAQIRNSKLDRYSSIGVGTIGQWISGKALNVDDNNIKMNNFNFYIDLSNHSEHGIVEVKTATLNSISGQWRFSGMDRDADNFLFVCMGSNKPWIDVEMAYMIPWEAVIHRISVAIVKNPSRTVWYKEFRIDENLFNDVYHTVDIPEFFSPFDLWKGKYNKNREKDVNR